MSKFGAEPGGAEVQPLIERHPLGVRMMRAEGLAELAAQARGYLFGKLGQNTLEYRQQDAKIINKFVADLESDGLKMGKGADEIFAWLRELAGKIEAGSAIVVNEGDTSCLRELVKLYEGEVADVGRRVAKGQIGEDTMDDASLALDAVNFGKKLIMNAKEAINDSQVPDFSIGQIELVRQALVQRAQSQEGSDMADVNAELAPWFALQETILLKRQDLQSDDQEKQASARAELLRLTEACEGLIEEVE